MADRVQGENICRACKNALQKFLMYGRLRRQTQTQCVLPYYGAGV